MFLTASMCLLPLSYLRIFLFRYLFCEIPKCLFCYSFCYFMKFMMVLISYLSQIILLLYSFLVPFCMLLPLIYSCLQSLFISFVLRIVSCLIFIFSSSLISVLFNLFFSFFQDLHMMLPHPLLSRQRQHILLLLCSVYL